MCLCLVYYTPDEYWRTLVSADTGVLYVVATPIGNLADMTHRAVEVLSSVALVAAEDTRHSRGLFEYFNIKTPLLSCHEHNEAKVTETIMGRLMAGQDVALISDAGTPLISDPGYHLIKRAAAENLAIVPIPGCSALIAALSVSGLATDRFFFEGFLPAKPSARRKRLLELEKLPHTLVFYESPHRLLETLADLVNVLGLQRPAVLAREITKMHETVIRGDLAVLHEAVENDANQRRGECVLMVSGLVEEAGAQAGKTDETELLKLLMAEMPLKKAVSLAVSITGLKKNYLYDLALTLKG